MLRDEVSRLDFDGECSGKFGQLRAELHRAA